MAGLINLSIQTSTIPDRTKLAQVTHLHKKNDPMDFRPVSVLTTISKLYENTISEQLCPNFENIFDQNLCFQEGSRMSTNFVKAAGGLERDTW